MNKAIFLDRDGVINALVYDLATGLVDSPYSLENFQLLPRVGEAVKAINNMGRLAIIISNQPGVAKGKCSPQTLDLLTQKMKAELAQWGARLDGISYCLHHPEATIEAYRAVCECRKPRPGLLLQAARELHVDLAQSYMIGDSPKDIQAGRAAGCRTILVDYGNGHPALGQEPGFESDFIAYDLFDAVRHIQGREKVHANIH